MSNPRVKPDNYDPHIVPAETAARKQREQESYKHPPEHKKGDLDTEGGYTVDKEGLMNNYPIEPEMYIEEPGDLRDAQESNTERRAEELHRVNENDEEGKLTMESDTRSKGPGVI